MSKYNHIKSIPIESIPKEEIAQAIREWAEGDEAMEKLLWACYYNGIKTSGCHAGAEPYISFKYQDHLEKLIPLIEITQNKVGSQVLILVDGGNPFSGEDWYLPSIGIQIHTEYQDEADAFFDELADSLKNESINKSHPMLRLLRFFLDKETGIILRFMHKEEDQYIFYIETTGIPDDRYHYYDQIFINAGLVGVVNDNSQPANRHSWKVEANQLDEILSKLNFISEYIISNFSFDVPKSENEVVSFIPRAKYMKRTLLEEDFEEWLKEQGIKFGIMPEEQTNNTLVRHQ